MIKVLMLGPARSVKGGMTSVVDNYYDAKLNEKVKLKYIETCNDSKYKISKLLKEIKGKLEFHKKINNYDVVHIHMASRRSTFRKAKYAHIAKAKGKRVILHIHGGEYKIFYNECNEEKKKYIRFEIEYHIEELRKNILNFLENNFEIKKANLEFLLDPYSYDLHYFFYEYHIKTNSCN